MCMWNIVQFISNMVGEDKIKDIRSWKLRIFLFIITIPLLSFLLWKSPFGLNLESRIKKNDAFLTRGGNIALLTLFAYVLYLA